MSLEPHKVQGIPATAGSSTEGDGKYACNFLDAFKEASMLLFIPAFSNRGVEPQL